MRHHNAAVITGCEQTSLTRGGVRREQIFDDDSGESDDLHHRCAKPHLDDGAVDVPVVLGRVDHEHDVKEYDLRNDRKQKAISEDTAQVEFCFASTVFTELRPQVTGSDQREQFRRTLLDLVRTVGKPIHCS